MTVAMMDSAAAVAAMGELYGKTDAEKFEDSWSRFKRAHRLDFMGYRIAHDRDRWSMYDQLKREWSDQNPELAGKFYSKAAGRIAQELRI